MKIAIGALVAIALAFGAYSLFVMFFAPSLYDFLIVATAVIAAALWIRWLRRRKKSTELAATSTD
ncbi:MAG: hypothetical protein IIZ13_13875 [Renibacterium sp.]|nr:hypothetical protein [Renibacterium sp.]